MTYAVPQPSRMKSTYSPAVSAKLAASAAERPVSITCVIPSERGLACRAGRFRNRARAAGYVVVRGPRCATGMRGRFRDDHAVQGVTQITVGSPGRSRTLEFRADGEDLQQLRHRESRRGEVLHVLRRRSSSGAVRPAGRPPRENAKFCMSCGSTLDPAGAPAQPAAATPPAPAQPPPAARATPADERRQVTVLFADLSGYTAVSERMDPESVKALVDGALRRLGEEVTRYGGTVDKYIGDNVMAIFGAPVAHEDDEERAVRAALGMQGAMDEINAELTRRHGTSFQLRVGINTGEVLAGAVGDGYTVIGDTVNVAARLQAAGRPGTVTVGERTYRATADEVEYRELDPLHLKGKAQPVPAWEAVCLVVRTADQARPRAGCHAARGPRRRAVADGVAVRPRHARAPAAPGHARRAGGRGQVAAAARVPPARRGARPRKHRPSARAAASPTARASSTGRSAR